MPSRYNATHFVSDTFLENVQSAEYNANMCWQSVVESQSHALEAAVKSSVSHQQLRPMAAADILADINDGIGGSRQLTHYDVAVKSKKCDAIAKQLVLYSRAATVMIMTIVQDFAAGRPGGKSRRSKNRYPFRQQSTVGRVRKDFSMYRLLVISRKCRRQVRCAARECLSNYKVCFMALDTVNKLAAARAPPVGIGM